MLYTSEFWWGALWGFGLLVVLFIYGYIRDWIEDSIIWRRVHRQWTEFPERSSTAQDVGKCGDKYNEVRDAYHVAAKIAADEGWEEELQQRVRAEAAEIERARAAGEEWKRPYRELVDGIRQIVSSGLAKE